MSEPVRFRPGTLWSHIVRRSQAARARGSLHPIATETRIIEDHGAQFQVRVVSSLVRKKQASEDRRSEQARRAVPANPFLPYEQDLFVADVSTTHVCLLNKYNVIDHHVLIVTREFEAQESPLTQRDFEALWTCMAEYDALAFYNSGPAAGASQPHKHLQLVPLPLAESARLPIEPLLATAAPPGDIVHIDRLPFAHAFARLDAARLRSPSAAANYTLDLYRSMLATAVADREAMSRDLPPYNLLATRDFMWIIPRSRSHFREVPVNALGFAGSFFVSEPSAAELILSIGPLTLLRQVSHEVAGPVGHFIP
jgi:ATP adenylyltransferase